MIIDFVSEIWRCNSWICLLGWNEASKLMISNRRTKRMDEVTRFVWVEKWANSSFNPLLIWKLGFVPKTTWHEIHRDHLPQIYRCDVAVYKSVNHESTLESEMVSDMWGCGGTCKQNSILSSYFLKERIQYVAMNDTMMKAELPKRCPARTSASETWHYASQQIRILTISWIMIVSEIMTEIVQSEINFNQMIYTNWEQQSVLQLLWWEQFLEIDIKIYSSKYSNVRKFQKNIPCREEHTDIATDNAGQSDRRCIIPRGWRCTTTIQAAWHETTTDQKSVHMTSQ